MKLICFIEVQYNILPLNLKYIAYIIRLQGHQKEFRYVMTYWEKAFSEYFNDVTLLQT